MALRLSKDLKKETTTPVEETKPGTSKGFDLTLDPGRNYDLDIIEADRDRKNTERALIAQVDDVENQTLEFGKTGELIVDKKEGDRQVKIKSTTVDYKKYLLDEKLNNSPSTPGWTPLVTGRRPVIIWQEGTDDNRDEPENEPLYDRLIKAIEAIKENEKKLDAIETDHKEYLNRTHDVAVAIDRQKDKTGWPLNVEDAEGNEFENEIDYRKLIPNVGAVVDFVKNCIELSETGRPGELEDTVEAYIKNETIITDEDVIQQLMDSIFYEVDESLIAASVEKLDTGNEYDYGVVD